jgi:hypothetical protein
MTSFGVQWGRRSLTAYFPAHPWSFRSMGNSSGFRGDTKGFAVGPVRFVYVKLKPDTYELEQEAKREHERSKR